MTARLTLVFILASTSFAATVGAQDLIARRSCPPDNWPSGQRFAFLKAGRLHDGRDTWTRGQPPTQCDPSVEDCPKHTPLTARNPMPVYFTAGDWTCLYYEGDSGAAPVWARNSDLRQVAPESSPRYESWVGRWINITDPYARLVISGSADHQTLTVSGRARWQGVAGVVHYGSINGSVTAGPNPLRVTQEACEVTLTQVEHYLHVIDNSYCGGANVRFNGIWRRAVTPKR